MVISYMEARQKAWLKQFNPAPRPYMIYCRHPLVSDRYIGAKQFHDHLLIEKREELCAILIALGARRIVWKNTPEWSRNYESPEGMAPALGTLEDTAVFLEQSAQWSHLVQERLLTWSTHANISFLYEDDYGLNDLIIDKILEKIDAHPECLNEYETTENVEEKESKSINGKNHARTVYKQNTYKIKEFNELLECNTCQNITHVPRLSKKLINSTVTAVSDFVREQSAVEWGENISK